MEATLERPSALRVTLTWTLMAGTIIFVVVAAVWWLHKHSPVEESGKALAGAVGYAIGSVMCGGFFLGLALLFYLATIVSGCFSFTFKRPMWKAARLKMGFANIVLMVLSGAGSGFLGGAILGPVLLFSGLNVQMARLLPLLLMLAVVQVASWRVFVWAPLEKRIIWNRLRTTGVSHAEVQSAILVGLSNQATGFIKRFGATDNDIGGLWLTPELLIYRGDGEQFGVTREQLVQMEQQTEDRTASFFGSTAQVTLHVSLSDGSIRPIRLHAKGHWTKENKRAAMDALADAIAEWHRRKQFVYTAKPVRLPKY